MKTAHLIILGSASYILFLLMLTPAATVLSLANIPPHTAQIEGVSGTLWNGSADRVTVNRREINQLSWSLNPLALFSASIDSDVSATVFNNEVTSNISYSLLSQQVTLTQLSSRINASEVQQAINLPFGVLEGQININVDELTLVANKVQDLTARLSWTGARLTLAEPVAFGNIFLNISSNDKGDFEGKLSNVNGDLSINGQLNLSKNQTYLLDATLTPRSNAPKELLNILNLLAPQKSGTAHVLKRQGHLRQLGITL